MDKVLVIIDMQDDFIDGVLGSPAAHIIVDASCCAGSTKERHKAALEVMKANCIEIIGEERNG